MSKNNHIPFLSLALLCFVVFFISTPRAYSDHCNPGETHDANGNCVVANNTTGQPVVTPDGSTLPTSPTLSNDGIYGCLGMGAQVQNVGTRAAQGGVYVPVNDAAVTLNTGFLVYKECILDGVTRKIAENISSEYTSQQIRAFNQGRNGGAYFVENEWEEIGRQNDIIVVNMLTQNTNVLCPAFRTSTRAAQARAYITTRNQPTAAYTCTLPTASGNGSFWGTLSALREPQNNPYGAYLILDAAIKNTLSANEYNQRERWLRSGGVYDRVTDLNDPLGARIVTPGYIIAQSISQVAGSGFRQLENASEIDQVVGNLFGGLATNLVADNRGLIGLTQSVNGQPSYLDRMLSETAANVRRQASNAALGVIGAALQIEQAFKAAKEAIAAALTSAIQRLRSAEAQCWDLIIPAVETYAQQNGNPTLTIATSTQFSQQIIDSQIAPVATTTINDIRASDRALTLLTQLATSISGSVSQAAQQQALLQLDTMIANRQIHTSTDATNAAQQRDNVIGAVETLVTDTITAWGDSTDPTVGWCNVNNTAVVERWFNEWRQ